jgi:small-conductance mechanosensitive channel
MIKQETKIEEFKRKKPPYFYFLVLCCLWVISFSLHTKGINLGFISEGKSIIRFIYIVFLILLTASVLSFIIGIMIMKKRGPKGETKMLTGFIHTLAGLGIIIAFIESIGKLTIFGVFGASFMGLLLGWSLQAPVSGVAAWVLITLRRPFRIGDRILFSSLGLVGDVVEVGFMYTVLNQVGGTVGSEDASGRNILIPNAMLFSQVVINYTARHEEPYSLDEVVWRITLDSDWDEAEKILTSAAEEVTKDIIDKTGNLPYVRADVYDYGIYMRLRYTTLATQRPKISHEINKIIFKNFQKNSKVDFAIPYVYSYRSGEKNKE